MSSSFSCCWSVEVVGGAPSAAAVAAAAPFFRDGFFLLLLLLKYLKAIETRTPVAKRASAAVAAPAAFDISDHSDSLSCANISPFGKVHSRSSSSSNIELGPAS